MKKNRIGARTLVSMLLVASVAAPVVAQQPTFKGKYRAIEVGSFTAAAGVEFPPDALEALTRETALQLVEAKALPRVFMSGAPAPEGDAGPTIRLTGTVVEYAKGNRAARYLVGFGAGKSKVKAKVQFIDAATNAVLLEDDVDGNVVMGGAFGGSSSGALRGLAKEIAKVVKKTF